MEFISHFCFEKIDNIAKITNYSNKYNLIVCAKAVYPKRKNIKLFIIKASEFLLTEDAMDLEKLVFEFELEKGARCDH